jgi:hypothetical protein
MNCIYRSLIKFKKSHFFILILFSITVSLAAVEVDTLFQSDKIIKIELRSDFTAIQKDRGENPEYHDGELVYKNKRQRIKLPVKLMVRGNFRRNPDNCEFPPLFVDFKKGDVKNTIFENQNKLKLVTPCRSDEYVLEEYIIYKMYNKVTDLSLKVRLVKIAYFDTGLKKFLFERYSFFIEDKDNAALRNEAFVKDRYLTPFDVDMENFKKMAVFQYLIGNKDWFITSRKNIIIMQPNDTTRRPYAVPYDFDFSAFINADYTKPKEGVDIFPDSRRLYKGLCYSRSEFEEVFNFYRKLKPEFMSVVRSQGNISIESNNQIVAYINQFYAIIKQDEQVKKEFTDVCETKKDYNMSEN